MTGLATAHQEVEVVGDASCLNTEEPCVPTPTPSARIFDQTFDQTFN